MGNDLETAKSLIGKKIRARRKAAGFKTQEKLAEKLGCDPSRISRWESGHELPDRTYRERLSKLISMPEEEWEPPSISAEDLPPYLQGLLTRAAKEGAAQVLSSKVSSPSADYEALSDDKRELIALIPTLDDGLVRQILGMLEDDRANQSETNRRTR